MQYVLLKSGDRDLARSLFATMGAIFGEESQALSDAYVDRLLAREDFFAIAALAGDRVAGGLTAYVIALTRKQASEVFIYDVAVRSEDRRKGIGRELVSALRNAACTKGCGDAFVLAENGDADALNFYRGLGGVASPVTLFDFERSQRPRHER
jgi:aminoglycoside 3-N-acetyltransferase I